MLLKAKDNQCSCPYKPLTCSHNKLYLNFFLENYVHTLSSGRTPQKKTCTQDGRSAYFEHGSVLIILTITHLFGKLWCAIGVMGMGIREHIAEICILIYFVLNR